MKKNMYSLMLSEDVVSLIDRMAGEAGTNRSVMINNILAEYLSYRTPEMRIKEMMEKLDSLFSPSDALQVMLRSSGSTFSLRSALAFKYNPTVHYNIELYRTMTDAVGELRAGLRTQNTSLRLYMMQFYKLWTRIETSYAGDSDYMIDGEKFSKRLILRSDKNPSELSEDDITEGIVGYVSSFDDSLKAFFYNLDDPHAATACVEKIYRVYFRSSAVIV